MLQSATETGNGSASAMEQLLGQMTRLLEQTHVQQQLLQEQQKLAEEWQRQAEEQTAQLIEHLGERRANHDNDGGDDGPTETSCDGQEWSH